MSMSVSIFFPVIVCGLGSKVWFEVLSVADHFSIVS